MEALSDPIVCEKISVATHIPLEVITGLDADQLEGFFDQIDTDMSGTVSFNEWVSALVQMRKNMHQEEKVEDAVMEEAVEAGVDAFEEATLGFGGELTFDDFWDALGDDIVCQKIADATHIPREFFMGLDKDQVRGFFDQIDTDMSGTVSFDEWVTAMVKMRQATYQEEKQDEA